MDKKSPGVTSHVRLHGVLPEAVLPRLGLERRQPVLTPVRDLARFARLPGAPGSVPALVQAAEQRFQDHNDDERAAAAGRVARVPVHVAAVAD